MLNKILFTLLLFFFSGSSIANETFDLLKFLESEIQKQEDKKDVRCWSSVRKLQMYLTQMPISSRAIAVRIRFHKKIIDGIFTKANINGDKNLSLDTLNKIIKKNYPYITDKTSSTIFKIKEKNFFRVIKIKKDDLKDYKDTIEKWRLLQSWAFNKSVTTKDSKKNLGITKNAALKLKEFLPLFDLALMKYAREIALAKKSESINKDIMEEAFSIETKIVP